MKRRCRWVVVGVLLPAGGWGQARFEVASVKQVATWPPPAGPAGQRGTGGGCPTTMKVDPERVDFHCATLGMLIGYAFGISPERVHGPEWMMGVGTPRYDIAANLPRGAARDQVPEMMRGLLAERFQLAVHRATGDLPVYALVVDKGGAKLERAAARGTVAAKEDAAAREAFYGTVESREVPAADGGAAETTIRNARMGTVRETGDPYQGQRWEAEDISLPGLADLLDKVAPLALPVVDRTGLSGRYRLVLEVSLRDAKGAGQDEMQDLVEAAFNKGLRKLGLRLERRKGPLETIVVDRVEKTPTGN